MMNGTSFAPGLVGDAFDFNGVNQYLEAPDSPTLDPANITVETWVYPTAVSASTAMIVVGKDGASYSRQYLLVLALAGNQLIARPHVGVASGYWNFDGVTPIPLNMWTHLAMTYDGSSLKLYVNGALDGSLPVSGGIIPTAEPLRIGGLPSGPWYFTGLIDEPSIYGRALEASEVQAIYTARGAGKCLTPVPASIVAQPANQTVTAGQTATFTVGPSGTSPFGYQWIFKGTNIPGATAASLVLTNVQISQAGSYSVQVTNAYGSATSSNATLVVNFPPATVKAVRTNGTAGQVVTVPVVLIANGNENALGFSLNYSPSLLSVIGVGLGVGASGGSLQVNTNQPGAIGIAIALSSGTTFAPGAQEVAEISFLAAFSTRPFSASLTFGDQPTKRELSDPTAHLLAANFAGDQVLLARSALEADVAPLPDGDGAVTIVDWVQVGRYAAALDSPTNASEFQRADCAPRSTMGDGLLTVSDWVQAGRYAAGLDQPTVAGGPSAPAGAAVMATVARKRGTDPNRLLNVQGTVVFQGQTGTITVNLDAQGNENAIGFSLAFDPSVLSYTSASLGSDAAGAAMDVNANEASSGRLGVILALQPTYATFTPGTRQVAKVTFQAVTPTSADSAVALTDTPVRREVADTNAFPLVALYADGTISLNPKPSLTITHSGQNISLAWPLWATNYILEAVGSAMPITTWTNLPVLPLLTNNAATVTLPRNGSVMFYRLQHQ
jgi:hypothetical protein